MKYLYRAWHPSSGWDYDTLKTLAEWRKSFRECGDYVYLKPSRRLMYETVNGCRIEAVDSHGTEETNA